MDASTTSLCVNSPVASVVLPVYNAGEYLDAAIESVLNQGFKNFELLLLNDGSTDGSLERLNAYAKHDPRCRVFSWPNRGLIATLNEGVLLSRADIIIRMDADDICYPSRFEKQLAYLEANPDCVAVGSRVMLIDPDNLPICPFVSVTTHDAIDAAHMAGRGGAIAHPSAAIRKAAILAAGGYRADFSHAEDIDLFLRLAEVGCLANLPEVLLDYRQHPNSIGYKYAKQQQDSARRAVMEAYGRRGISDHPAENCKPSETIECPADVHRKWSWWALSGGNLRTARKHAIKAIRANPLDVRNLKLLACVLRGY